jgi:hypothetical protein
MRYFLFITILFFTFLFSNCSSPAPTNNSGNNTAGNSSPNTAKSPSNSGGIPTPVPSASVSTTNNAPTLTPVVQGFYEALKKKDEAGVKKYLSAAALKYWEDEGKTEKKTWLVYLSEDQEPVDEKREVRNEQIGGEKAVAEIKGGNLGVWTKIAFIKENGEWKFDSPKISFNNLDIPKTTTKPNNPNG